MRRRRFSAIVLVFLFIIIGMGGWRLMWPTMATQEKSTETAIPAKGGVSVSGKIEAPKPLAPPPLAPSVALAAPKPDAAPIADTPPPDPNDPQTELKTAIPDIAHFVRVGDLSALWQAYTPPNELNPQRIEQLREQQQAAALAVNNPQQQLAAQDYRDKFAKSIEELVDQLPTYNAADDEATYTWNLTLNGSSMHDSFIFIKINGKWYVKQGPSN